MVKKGKVRFIKTRISRNKQRLAECQLILSETEQTIAQQQVEQQELVKLLAESEQRIKDLEQSLLTVQGKLATEQKKERTLIQDSFIEVFGKNK